MQLVYKFLKKNARVKYHEFLLLIFATEVNITNYSKLKTNFTIIL